MPEVGKDDCFSFMNLPQFELLSSHNVNSQALNDCDATIVVFHDVDTLSLMKSSKFTGNAFSLIKELSTLDESSLKAKEVNFILNNSVPGGKLIFSAVGPLLRDYDDVRRYSDAVTAAIRRVKATGSIKKPLLVLQPPPFEKMDKEVATQFERYYEVSSLAALAELHEPLEAREFLTDLKKKEVQSIKVLIEKSDEQETLQKAASFISAIEEGRRLARDIGGPDPERMSSIKAAEAIKKYFANENSISVKVIEDIELMKKEYPLLAAVARASEHVPRHAPRIVQLEYKSPDQSQVTEELFMVGKGINYDTGGADLKVGGNMVGMSRDKCGAAALAGFMATCARLQPKNLNISIDLAFVRNSIGSNAYVSDEIITSRAGVRVRIGNTDAEGRMVMGDLLAQMKEAALNSSDPSKARLFTCATLTGHVRLAYGPYSAAMDNGPARFAGVGERLKSAGQLMGDCFEVSTLRREDYELVAATSNCDDLRQANRQPSVATYRGHQYPAAFLQIASGLNKHGLDAAHTERLSYTHLDIAGSAEEHNSLLGRVTGSPIPALTTAFLSKN